MEIEPDITDNASHETRSDSRVILVAPPYLAGDKARSMLYPNAAPIESGTARPVPTFFDGAQNLVITDLSGQEHQAFNEVVLSGQADILLLIADSAFGLEKRDFWSKMVGGLAAIPHVILAVDTTTMADGSKERFEALKAEYSEYSTGFDDQELTIVPVDFRAYSHIGPAGRPSWYDGMSLSELLAKPGQEKGVGEDDTPLQSSDQFAIHIYWKSDEPMLPGRQYQLTMNENVTDASISDLKHRISPDTLEQRAAKSLHSGDIGYANISLEKPIEFAPFAENRQAGYFQLVDKQSDVLVAICMIKHGLRRATNIHWQDLKISKSDRSGAMHQTPCVLWFTGLSGSGKSAIASLVEQMLHQQGHFTYALDGDNVRHGLCRDLGFTDADRVENLRRVSETAKLFVDAGMIVLVSFISPFGSERQAARELFDEKEFLEIFVDTPLEVCEARDPKGLYKLARAGDLKNFTGIDSPYEAPENPEIRLPGGDATVETLAGQVITGLEKRGMIQPEIS